MTDSSDEDFQFSPIIGKSKKGKGMGTGKAKAQSLAQQKKANALSLDSLLAESKSGVERKEKLDEGLNMQEVRDIIDGDYDKEKFKQELHAKNQEAALAQEEALKDESISIPGVLQVFRPAERGSLADLSFDISCPRKELSVLFEALKRAARDPDDLEELLRGGLVAWLRQKQDGKAPPEVCRWLVKVLACHSSPSVVFAAEEAALELLVEPNQVWKLRHEDMQWAWRACGAVWLEEDADGKDENDREVGGMADGPVRRNLGPFLNVMEACLRSGAHDMTDEQLGELLLDLCAAALDEGVCASCQGEVYRTLEAVVDCMSLRFYQDTDKFSALVDRICDPAGRKLSSQMEPLSLVLLARNVPFKRLSQSACEGGKGGGGGGGGGGKNSTGGTVDVGEQSASSGGHRGTTEALSLRHEVCHRLLKHRFLDGTPYGKEESVVGFSRTVKAIEVMLDDDDILEDDSSKGYQRQYAVVALANEMSAGALAVSETGRPDYWECKRLLDMLDLLNKQMRDVMQGYIQMCKTLLDMMKSKLTPYAVKTGHQGTLSAFIKKPPGGQRTGDSDDDDDDDDDSHDDESLLGSQSQSQPLSQSQ